VYWHFKEIWEGAIDLRTNEAGITLIEFENSSEFSTQCPLSSPLTFALHIEMGVLFERRMAL
jgi:hypothetical protein